MRLKKAERGNSPDKPQTVEPRVAQHFPKRVRYWLFRLALLTVLLAWPASQAGQDDASPRYDDLSPFEGPRRLRAAASMHSNEVGDVQHIAHHDGKERDGQSGPLDENAPKDPDVYQKWKEGCQDIIDRGIDILKYSEGKKCWKSCGDLLAVRILESWPGQKQRRLQESIFVFNWPQYVWFLSYVALFYFTCSALLYLWQGESILLFLLAGTLSLSGFLLHTWLSITTWLTMIAAMVVDDPEDVYVTVPWAAKWIAVYRTLKFHGLEAYSIPALPLKVTTMLTGLLIFYLLIKVVVLASMLAEFLVGKHGPHMVEITFLVPGMLIIAMVMWYLFVGFVMHTILAFFTIYSSGSHGVVWVCLKSSAASAFGWMPPTAPFAMGLAYAVCAFLHGVLQEFPRYQNGHTWLQNIRKGKISDDFAEKKTFIAPDYWFDKFKAPLMLLAKFGVIFADISFDFAQTVLFFCRGQIYFGMINITGVVIQMSILLFAMAQGISSHEASLMEVLFQSDSIVHFRSSWQAGMVVTAFYEKIYREAFGETYISMVIAIVAVFTVPLEYPSDCGLFIISICLSLSSVMSGVADALEFCTAEQEMERTRKYHMRQIPGNNYIARKKYREDRAMMGIGFLRVAEALAPIVMLALCIKTASAKVTMVFAMAISATIFAFSLFPSALRQAKEIFKSSGTRGRTERGVDTDSIESESRSEREDTSIAEKVFGILACTGSLLIFLLLLAIAFTLMVIFSPFFFFLPYKSSVAIPKIGEFLEPIKLRDSITTLSNFKPFMLGKCLWVLCFMIFFSHAYLFPEQSYCKMAPFVEGIFTELSHMLRTRQTEIKALIAAVQVLLMAGAFFGWIFMAASSYCIESKRKQWAKKDAEATHIIHSVHHSVYAALNDPLGDFCNYQIPDDDDWMTGLVDQLGIRHTVSTDPLSMIQAMLKLLVVAIYGVAPPDLDLKELYKTDRVQATLRSIIRPRQMPYHSPSAMGEDLIQFARMIPKTRNDVWKIPMKVRNLIINMGLSFQNVSVMGIQDLLEDTSPRQEPQCHSPYVLLPSQEDYVEGGGKCESGRHDMVLSDTVQAYHSYVCNICGRHKQGKRWFCKHCSDDYCFQCRPQVEERGDLDEDKLMKGVMSWRTVKAGDLKLLGIKTPLYVLDQTKTKKLLIPASSTEVETTLLNTADMQLLRGCMREHIFSRIKANDPEVEVLALLSLLDAEDLMDALSEPEKVVQKISDETEIEVLSPIKQCLDIRALVSKIPSVLKKSPSEDLQEEKSPSEDSHEPLGDTVQEEDEPLGDTVQKEDS